MIAVRPETLPFDGPVLHISCTKGMRWEVKFRDTCNAGYLPQSMFVISDRSRKRGDAHMR